MCTICTEEHHYNMHCKIVKKENKQDEERKEDSKESWINVGARKLPK